MEFTVGRTRVKLRFAFAAAVSLLLLMDSGGTCALSLAACVLHECGHLVCMLILGEHPEEVRLSFYGVMIKKRSLPEEPGNEILVALAGPAVNFAAAVVLFALSKRCGERLMSTVLINLCIGAFNMLPCIPLDAGRALFFAFSVRYGEKRAAEIMRGVTAAVLVPLFAAGIFVFLKCGKNFSLLAAAGYILFMLIGEKTVAKKS